METILEEKAVIQIYLNRAELYRHIQQLEEIRRSADNQALKFPVSNIMWIEGVVSDHDKAYVKAVTQGMVNILGKKTR